MFQSGFYLVWIFFLLKGNSGEISFRNNTLIPGIKTEIPLVITESFGNENEEAVLASVPVIEPLKQQKDNDFIFTGYCKTRNNKTTYFPNISPFQLMHVSSYQKQLDQSFRI